MVLAEPQQPGGPLPLGLHVGPGDLLALVAAHPGQVGALEQRQLGRGVAGRDRADVARLDDDLDLLCGTALPQEAPPPPPTAARQVIPDHSYAHDFWMDAEDEGLGRSDRR